MRGLGITNNGTLLSSNVSILTVGAPFNFSQGANSEVVTLNHSLSGVTAGTYNNLVVNTFGLVTSASNISYLTNNQTISISGDASGSGTTSISLTLATVNSTPGTFSAVVINSKGLATVGANLIATGDVSGTASGGSIILTLSPTGISAGTYQSVVVNTKGIITSGTSLGYTPSAPVVTSAGTYNTVVINNAGQVILGSNATYGSGGGGAVSVTATGAVTGSASSSNGTISLPLTFSTNGTFLGNLTVVGSLTAGYIDNSIIGSTTPVAGTFTNLAANNQAVVGSGTDGTLFEDNYSTGYLGDILSSKPFFAILRTTGQVGSVNQSNYNSAPVFRNTLDDGSGNFIVPGNATIGTMTVGVITATGGLTGPSGQKYFFGPPGTFNNFVISSTGSVAGSFINYGTSGTSSLASISITATGVATGTSTGSNGIYSLPLVFSSNPTFTGTLVAASMSVTSASFSGILTGPPSSVVLSDSSLNVATTSFVKGQNYLFANGSSGTFNNFIISSNGSVTPSFSTYGTGNAGSVIISATGAATGTSTGSNGTYSLPLTLATSGVTPGTYTKYVVNSYGLITTGLSLASSDVSSVLGYTPAQFINGNATINFGSPGTSTTSVSVSASAINSLTFPMVYVSGTSSTSSNGTLAHSQADLFFSLSVTSITPGTGFTISAYSRSGTLTGQYVIQYLAFIPPVAGSSFINPVTNYETPPSTSFTYSGPVTVSAGGTLAVPTGYVMYVT